MRKTLLMSLGLLALTACGPEYSSDAECLVKERQGGFEGSTGALLQFCSEDQRKETLAERNVSVSLRGSALRLSPNVYNDEVDVGVLLEALKAAR